MHAILPVPVTTDRDEIVYWLHAMCALTGWETTTRLANESGLAPSTINRYTDLTKEVKHVLSTRSMGKVQEAVVRELHRLYRNDYDAMVAAVNNALTKTHTNTVPREGAARRKSSTTADVFFPEAPNLRRPIPATDPLDQIPIRSTGQGGKGDSASLEGSVIGWVRRPASLVGYVNGYAIHMPGDGMEPRYKQGWLLYVNPDKPPVVGRDVVVYRAGGGVLVRELAALRSGVYVLRQLNPEATIEIAEDQVREIGLIVGVDQEG